MASDENQRLVFDYLLERLRDPRPFEKVELQAKREPEIRMVESGTPNRLHIWRIESVES
jgi:hypothetical protein